MSEYLLVKRELLERCIKANDEPQPSQLYADLRAALAQEAGKVVERQVVAWEVSGNGVKPGLFYGKPSWAGEGSGYELKSLSYTSPPAPVSVVLPEREHVPETELYNTNIDEVAYAEGWNNAIDKVKELNQ
jgi:hypothetical protein